MMGKPIDLVIEEDMNKVNKKNIEKLLKFEKKNVNVKSDSPKDRGLPGDKSTVKKR
jgi:hypothetical protein